MKNGSVIQLIEYLNDREPQEIEVARGVILNNLTNINEDYKITFGWDVLAACRCDTSWKAFRLRLADYLGTLAENDREHEAKKIQSEDNHWEWFNKSVLLKRDEYKWFFFRSPNEIEAACLIYHPKQSALSTKNVFYIEFIAVAPWNRYHPMEEKKYKNIGTIFLREMMKHCKDALNFNPGVCLHSLPQAQGFYEHTLSMVHIAQEDKDGLWYYEMSEDKFLDFVGVA